MPNGGAWSNSNRTRMLSNVHTTQYQGGGSKKAGFPYLVGRDHWTSRFLGATEPVSGRCCKRSDFEKTLVFTRNTIRPLGNDPRISMR